MGGRVEKEDLVRVWPGPEAADVFLETLDGQRPNAVDHPRRAELTKPENGFVPTGIFFADPTLLKNDKVPASLGLLGFSNVKKLDVRWGFQDGASMTIARIGTSGPRTGLLALLDGSTFDKGKLPPIPESVTGFTVVSLDLKSTMDKLVALAKTFKPDAEDQLNQMINSLKAKTKLRLKEDVLAHLGPKVAWYILPAKSLTTSPALGFEHAQHDDGRRRDRPDPQAGGDLRYRPIPSRSAKYSTRRWPPPTANSRRSAEDRW